MTPNGQLDRTCDTTTPVCHFGQIVEHFSNRPRDPQMQEKLRLLINDIALSVSLLGMLIFNSRLFQLSITSTSRLDCSNGMRSNQRVSGGALDTVNDQRALSSLPAASW